MRIAIEFFGHFRTFEQCADNVIENLIAPLIKGNEVDIFVHTWNETDSSSAVWHNERGEKRGGKLEDEHIAFLKRKLKPKKMVITPQVVISEEEYEEVERRGHSRRGYYSALKNSTYSRMKANDLKIEYEKEKDIKYDLVIQTRMDVFYMTRVNILRVRDMSYIENKIFYSWTGSQDYYFNYPVDNGCGGTDILYFGSSGAMDKFSNLYNKINDIDFSRERSVAMEFLLFKNAESQNLIPISFNFYTHRDYILLRTEELRSHVRQVTNFKPVFRDVIQSLIKISYYSIFLIFLILFNAKFKKRYKFIKRIQKCYEKFFAQVPNLPSDIL